jgi:ribonuclease E
MSRQRLRPSISESTNIVCPRCTGMGTIRSVESLALALLRLIGEEARKERTAKVIAQLPVDVATYLMNEKREWLNSIESKGDVDIVLVPNKYLETPAYEIRRIRDDETLLLENAVVSHQIAVQPTVDALVANKDKKPVAATPLVTTITPSAPAPASIALEPEARAPQKEQIGIFVRLWRFFFGTGTSKTTQEPSPARTHSARREQERHREHRGRDMRRGGDRSRQRERGFERSENRGEHRSANAERNNAPHEKRNDRPQREAEHRREREQQRPVQPAAATQSTAAPQTSGGPRPESSSDGVGVDAGRGERRSRRGRRRRGRGGRSRDDHGTAGQFQRSGENAESPSEARSNSESSAPAPSGSTPEGGSGRHESVAAFDGHGTADHGPSPANAVPEKTVTVWSSGSSASSSSWGPGRDD